MLYTPDKSIWLNPNIDFLFNSDIIEYDIQDAGFSLTKEYHLLPNDVIKELESLPKGIKRHKQIGIIQRDNKIFTENLLQKFTEVREWFIKVNNLTDNDIISVKKDAIYTIGEVDNTKLNSIIFRNKNIYSSYIRFPDNLNMEIYYYDNKLDIKGMTESCINRHRLHMIEFLRQTINMIENHDSKVKRFIINFINDYKNQLLDEMYYLEFNNISKEFNPAFNYLKIIIPLVQIIQKEVS